jgi:hypothetical protein
LAINLNARDVGRVGAVAMMMFLALTSCVLPSSPVTAILSRAVNLPAPINTSILFFFIKKPTPLVNRRIPAGCV